MNERVDTTVTEIIYPAFVRDIKAAIAGRFFWKHCSDVCEAVSKVLAGAASVLAFSAGVYEEKALSFASGCVGTCSIVLGLFSSYASSESKERTVRLNVTLQRLGLGSHAMPSITGIDPAAAQSSSPNEQPDAQPTTDIGSVTKLIQEYELHHANLGNQALEV